MAGHLFFISYSSRHRALTAQLAATLEAQYGAGSVWWDQALEARGTPFATQIQAALEAARVVLVVWTAEAAVSHWVQAEAARAQQLGTLLHLLPPDLRHAQLPLPFNTHHVLPITGDTPRLLRDVAAALAGKPVATTVPLDELYWHHHGQWPVDARQTALPADPLDISPSQLLQARYAAVPYRDGTGQHEALLRWALQHPRPSAGLLLHAPGGVGKTRLLIELAATLRQQHGWKAGFVERPAHPQAEALHRQALQQMIADGDEPGALLVLDYAEGRDAELVALARWIRARPDVTPTPRPLRLVLLTRSAGEWWQQLRDREPELQTLFSPRPGWPAEQALAPFATAADRQALFDASRSAYTPVLAAQGLQPPPADAPVPEALRQQIAADDEPLSPLALQMAALVWLGGNQPPATAATAAAEAPATPTDWAAARPLGQVLGLERRHADQALAAGSPTGLDPARRTALDRAIAQLTLVQGVPSRDAARTLLQHDGHYAGLRTAPVSVDGLLADLQRLYGDGQGGLRPLEPDLLGEHWVAQVGDAALLDGCVAWVDQPPAVEGTADGNGPTEPDATRLQFVDVVQRATQAVHGPAARKAAGRLLIRLAGQHAQRWAPALVETLTSTEGDGAELLEAQVPHWPADQLDALEAHLPLLRKH